MSRGATGLVSRLLLLRTRAAAQGAKSSPLASGNVLRVVASWPHQSSRLKTSLASHTGITSDHTAKWMTNYDIKSPQELIAEVPPIEVDARVVACEGGRDPSLGHPVEYICLDLPEPNPCKYCGLRYVQAHHDHHH